MLGRDFVSLWAGQGYGDAFWVAVAVMIPLTVDLIQNLGLTILQVMNRYAFRGKVYLALAAVNILVSVFVVPRWGTVGSAVSSGVCMFLGNGIVMNWYYQARAGLDMKLFWREVASCGAPLVVVAAAFVAVRASCRSAAWTGPAGPPRAGLPSRLFGGLPRDIRKLSGAWNHLRHD